MNSSIDISKLAESGNNPLILEVNKILSGRGVKAYVVGGWLRDLLLGRDAGDIDFAVSGDGIEAALAVADVLGGAGVPLDRSNGVGRVVLSVTDANVGDPDTLDFASLQGAIDEDLSRRDFTVDAMAVDLELLTSGADISLIDPFGGLTDLRNRTLRATTDAVFPADPDRLLRAVRLSAQLGFTIEPETESMIRRYAGLISTVAGERVREELASLLSLPGSGRFLACMDTFGLLGAIMPEIEVMRGVTQPKEHVWDVLTHCLRTVEALDYLLRQGDWPYANALGEAPWSPEMESYFAVRAGSGTNRAALLRLAALLHDVAKPSTRSVEPGGRIRFLGHGDEGAETARNVLERLRFSNREIKVVEIAVKYHLRPTQMGWPELPTRRALYRYFRDAGEAAAGIVYLSLADHLAARGPSLDRQEWTLHADISRHILSQREEEPARPRRLIDGYDIMKSFGLRPGHRVGELLESVREAQAAGEVTSKEEALALVGRALGTQASRGPGQDEKDT